LPVELGKPPFGQPGLKDHRPATAEVVWKRAHVHDSAMDDSHKNELRIALQLVAADLYRETGSSGYCVEMPHPKGGALLFVCGDEEELQRVLRERAAAKERPVLNPVG